MEMPDLSYLDSLTLEELESLLPAYHYYVQEKIKKRIKILKELKEVLDNE